MSAELGLLLIDAVASPTTFSVVAGVKLGCGLVALIVVDGGFGSVVIVAGTVHIY